jgi:hypothetical protein
MMLDAQQFLQPQFVPKIAGSNPAEAVGFFGQKNP